MKSTEKWEIIHGYYRLVNRGAVEPVKCPSDDSGLVPRLNKTNEPTLWCMECNSYYELGLDNLDQLKKVIDEG